MAQRAGRSAGSVDVARPARRISQGAAGIALAHLTLDDGEDFLRELARFLSEALTRVCSEASGTDDSPL